MIRINNIKLPIDYTEEHLKSEIAKSLRYGGDFRYEYFKKSIDARDKANIRYIISVNVFLQDERFVIRKVHNKNIMLTKQEKYSFTPSPAKLMTEPPVIIGAGPAGLVCGLHLAKMGYKPVILERGADADTRKKMVEDYWNGTSGLNPDTNVQFGEGGAGTFSDGKLNTGIKDKSGRRSYVMDLLIEAGAPDSIRYINKPHLGTDMLCKIVKNMRHEIIRLGGKVLFNAHFTGFESISEDLTRIYYTYQGSQNTIATNALVLAIGHSARDTFAMLSENPYISMEQKPFAMGVRIMHEREFIDRSLYGDTRGLPAADYKFTHQCQNGRSVYTFCMCPGGYVVDASSEEGGSCVNGMSYSGRAGRCSNSAVVVNVTPADFKSDNILAGVELQRELERAAYKAGQGSVPVQLFADFANDRVSSSVGHIPVEIKGKWAFAKVNSCLPEYIKDAIIEGVLAFDEKMPGFADGDAVIAGVEARTSSPVRIVRDENLVIPGTCIYPCGEGAGYAGGITSASVDGIKVAEAIMSQKGYI